MRTEGCPPLEFEIVHNSLSGIRLCLLVGDLVTKCFGLFIAIIKVYIKLDEFFPFLTRKEGVCITFLKVLSGSEEQDLASANGDPKCCLPFLDEHRLNRKSGKAGPTVGDLVPWGEVR